MPENRGFFEEKNFLKISVLHNFSECCFRIYGLDPGIDRVQSLQQEPVFMLGDSHRFLWCTRPAERSVFKTFIQEEKSVAFPKKCFKAVATSSAKKEQDILLKRIQMEVSFYDL